jgi:hypothetical protein
MKIDFWGVERPEPTWSIKYRVLFIIIYMVVQPDAYACNKYLHNWHELLCKKSLIFFACQILILNRFWEPNKQLIA